MISVEIHAFLYISFHSLSLKFFLYENVCVSLRLSPFLSVCGFIYLPIHLSIHPPRPSGLNPYLEFNKYQLLPLLLPNYGHYKFPQCLIYPPIDGSDE